MRTNTLKEYEKYKKAFTIEVLDTLQAKSREFFTIDEFIYYFRKVQIAKGVEVKLEWAFIDFSDRVERHLYKFIKSGLLSEEDGIYTFNVKPVLNNYLQAQAKKLTLSPNYGYGVKIVSNEDLTETNFMLTDLEGLVEILSILNKNKEWKENA